MQKKSHSCSALPSFYLQRMRSISSSCSSLLVVFIFFVARCRYRNPFSLLVRVIRGFKTAFHHQTLQRFLKRAMPLRRKTGTTTTTTTTTTRTMTTTTTRMTTVTKAREEFLVLRRIDRMARRESSGEF